MDEQSHIPTETLDHLLGRFRRDLRLLQILRWGYFVGLLVVIVVAQLIRGPWANPLVMGTLLAFAALWFALAAWSTRRAQAVQLGSALVAAGELETASSILIDAMATFTMIPSVKLTACQQLATVAQRQGDHQATVRLGRALLRQPLRRARWLSTQCRLVVADSLLTLNESAQAYDVFRPVYDVPLSLADRLALLPIQLRYELETGHAESAVRALGEKVRLAELLDAPKAALVHALLAEACHRQNQSDQCGYLAERAALYHDPELIARSYPIVAPVLTRPHA